MGHKELRRVHACPVETSLELISGRWKARILWKLYHRPLRFGELRRELDGITEKMLTQQLRSLEHDELITRTVHQHVPPHVEYNLSPFGRTLAPMFELLAAWGSEHYAKISAILHRDTA